MTEKTEAKQTRKVRFSLDAQAWTSLAVFMTFGLLFEGLIGYRSPSYLNDPMRRELFRLAHAHGTILSLLLLVADQYLASHSLSIPRLAYLSLRIGAVIMPIGFLLGGSSHTETDPHFLIILSPIGGILLIFGTISLSIASLKK